MDDVRRIKTQLTAATGGIEAARRILDEMADRVRGHLVQVDALVVAGTGDTTPPQGRLVWTGGAGAGGRQTARRSVPAGPERRADDPSVAHWRRRSLASDAFGGGVVVRRTGSPAPRQARADRQASRSLTAPPVRSTRAAVDPRRERDQQRRGAERDRERADDLDVLASPTAIRGGMVIGATGGMNDDDRRASRRGRSSTAKERKKPTSSRICSGVSTDCRSSWRDTSDAAHANAAP